MKKDYNSDSSKLDRKTVEKNRRLHMKALSFKHDSLIPKRDHFHKDTFSQQDCLDHATLYIKQLRERLNELNRKKQLLLGTNSTDNAADLVPTTENMPVPLLRDMGAILEVILVSSLNKNFMLYQVIAVLEEEGVDVVSASFSIVADKIYYPIHSQVVSTRIGVDTSRIFLRLKELAY